MSQENALHSPTKMAGKTALKAGRGSHAGTGGKYLHVYHAVQKAAARHPRSRPLALLHPEQFFANMMLLLSHQAMVLLQKYQAK